MTGITFLMQRVGEGETGLLSQEQVMLIRDTRRKLSDAFKLTSETVVLMFRVGHNSSPSALSLRQPLESRVNTILE